MTSPPAHLQQVGEGKFPSPLAPLQQAGEGEECNVVDEFFFRVFCEKICVVYGKHLPHPWPLSSKLERGGVQRCG